MSVRFDRGTLARPQRTGGKLVIEGHAARVHGPANPLAYEWGNEYRDEGELRRVVSQLTGAPVTLNHPNGLIRGGAKARVIGRVDAAWIDGDHAAVRLSITDEQAIAAIESGTNELSLGSEVDADASGYQRNTRVDHLAVVPVARCGGTCSLRTDCNGACSCAQKGPSPMATNDEYRAKIEPIAKAAGVRVDAAMSTRDMALEALRALGVDTSVSHSADDATPLEQRSDAYVHTYAVSYAPTAAELARLDSESRLDDRPSPSASRAREEFVQRQNEAWKGKRTDAMPAPEEAPTTPRDEMIARNNNAWKNGGGK